MTFKRNLVLSAVFITLLTGVFLFMALCSEINWSAEKKPGKIKTWKLPIYMQENLQWMVNDFNKRFEAKIESYKTELRLRFKKEYKRMPADVILDLEAGVFMRLEDFMKLQAAAKARALQELKKQEGGKINEK